MNRLGLFLLNIAVALYLFANGILGLTKTRNSEFFKMVGTIFGSGKFTEVLTVILSVCAIVAGVFLLLTLFRNNVALTELILLVFIILWIIYIILVDIINPLKGGSVGFLTYLTILSAHIMVLGALLSSTRRFGILA